MKNIFEMEDGVNFLRYINTSLINKVVYWGSGDGFALRQIKEALPKSTQVLCYETDESSRQKAKSINNDILFTGDLDTLDKFLFTMDKKMIIFNGSLHREKDFEQVIEYMKKFSVIVIYDVKEPLVLSEPISEYTRSRIDLIAPRAYKEFTEIWGDIDDKEHLYRFFIGYLLNDGFKTNIYSIPWSDIHVALNEDYSLTYEKTLTSPFIREEIMETFNHRMKDTTHKQMIFLRDDPLVIDKK